MLTGANSSERMAQSSNGVRPRISMPQMSPIAWNHSICGSAMVNSDHKNHFLVIIDGIKKSVIPYPVTPGHGRIPFQFFDMLAKVGLLLELGVNIGVELGFYAFLLAAKVLTEIPRKLGRFKYLKAIQRACPSFSGHRHARL